ncbi:MAG: hypothetical protein D6736_12240 [Nitrospinota bacterium]|nr:MAG: hypothetical protein D6736_12240 [Nitrospinota bacterium]
MYRYFSILVIPLFLLLAGCATSYKAQPVPFKVPTAYENVQQVDGALIAAQAYADAQKAKEAFGFDIRGAGMLPVQVVFDNQGTHPLEINAAQTFLEDAEGNLWPILSSKIAYERATKYAQTKQIFKEGAYGGFLGATAGAIIGAAVGVVTGENVAESTGKGAAAGAAAGATLGGLQGYANADEARHAIISDLQEKSLQNKAVPPQNLAYGFLFFPGEARSAKRLRLQIIASDTGAVHVLTLNL